MVPLLVACLVHGQPNVEKVSLKIAADTVIDRQSPDANAGREPVLKVGDGRVLLIRFPELGTRYGAGKRVKSAVLTLSLAGSTAHALVSVNKILKPWEEGGVFKQAFDDAVSVTPIGDATWNSAMKGVLNWGKPGVRGEDDYELLPEIKSTSTDGRIVFTGLERAVQSFVIAQSVSTIPSKPYRPRSTSVSS